MKVYLEESKPLPPPPPIVHFELHIEQAQALHALLASIETGVKINKTEMNSLLKFYKLNQVCVENLSESLAISIDQALPIP